MKRRFSKILGVGLTLALLASLLLTAAPVSADVNDLDVILGNEEISAESTYTITFDVNEVLGAAADITTPTCGSSGSAVLSDAQHRSGTQSWLMDAGVAGGSNAGRVRIEVPGIPIADFDGATFWLYEPEGTTVGGAIPNEDQIYPYGTPYINIILDLDGDGNLGDTEGTGWDKLEGIGSIPVGSTRSPTTHPAPTVDTWVQMEEGYGYYDTSDSMNQGTWTGPGDGHPWEIGTLAEWKDYLATEYVDCEVAGIEITFGFWGPDVPEDVWVDDIAAPGIGSITVEFPEGTVVADTWADGEVTVQSTAGFGDANDTLIDVGNDVVTTVDDDIYTVTIGLGQLAYAIAEGASVRLKFLGDQITNPDDAGDYTLWVNTSEETDAVESETYTIEVPEIEGLPGVVSVYNPSGILMVSYTGDNAVKNAIDKADDEDWVIKLGPGTYGAVDTFAADVEGVTFEARGDVTWEGIASIEAADVVIDGITFDGDGKPVAVTVNGDGTGVSFEDCAFEDADILLQINADDIAIEDCTFTMEDGIGIDVIYTVVDDGDLETTPPVITDCSFTIEEDGNGIGIKIDADIEVTGCSFTVEEDGEGVGIEVNDGESVIEDSTFDSLETVLDIDLDLDGGTVDFSGNTIADCVDVAIIVTEVAADGKVLIHNNTITGCDDAVILDVDDDADAGVVAMLFNDITDNAGDDDLLVNNGADDDLYVINNWWGDADGPSQGEDAFSDDVVYEPFLTGPVSDSVIDAATADFDAEDECGVTVTSAAEGDPMAMDIVGASKYAENPAADIDDAIGFWDVCMIGDAVDEVTIRFYTDVTEDTEVYVWGAARGEWLQCDPLIAVPNLFSGFIAVTVGAATTPTLDDLGALPFAVVEPPAEAAELDPPLIISPEGGERDTPLTPTFAWSGVADADGYYFQFADNAAFAVPLVKLDGDLGRLITTAYAYRTELPYSKAYYWRVKAVSGTIDAGDLGESDWVSSVFITMAEPEEPTPPIVIEDVPPPVIDIEQPDIIIESPDIIVPLPAETPITPSWIYVIIAVGAVLVIALIVLIVRTRRIA